MTIDMKINTENLVPKPSGSVRHFLSSDSDSTVGKRLHSKVFACLLLSYGHDGVMRLLRFVYSRG